MRSSELKQGVSRRLIGETEHFWQKRYYDFNIRNQRQFAEKLRYIHRNPVKRGLCERPDDWEWSSFRHYATGIKGRVEIESEWAARKRERAAGRLCLPVDLPHSAKTRLEWATLPIPPNNPAGCTATLRSRFSARYMLEIRRETKNIGNSIVERMGRMSWISRRSLLATTGMGILSGSLRRVLGAESTGDSPADKTPAESQKEPLALTKYQPVSMLHLKETHVPRARYPVIDFHTHLTFSAHVVNGVSLGAERRIAGQPEELLPIMERRNILALTNLTGGFAVGLQGTVAQYDKRFPTRFYTFTEPSYNLFQQSKYPQLQADAILAAHQSGARGLKILKTLGLSLREQTTTGNLVKVDDLRFDPMWEACAGLRMPVAIHVSDPLAFFTSTDRFNERYEELNNHPDWSYFGAGFPSNAEILEARNRVFARHPRTNFVALHVGNFAENLVNVSQNLDRFPNMYVDIAARLNELGRQPRAARKFFDKYQDRIVFGTDATPHGDKFPQQVFNDSLYEIYFRFLETDDEYFDYAPAPVPPQGRWKISGIDLPDGILHKVYHQNAARLLHVAAG